MKNNRIYIRILAIAMLVITVMTVLSSCQGLSEEKKMEMKTSAENFVECLMKNDMKKAFSYVDKRYITEADFKTSFPQLVEYVGGFSEYKVTGPTGFYTGINNGISYTKLTYLVDTDGRDFYIEVGTVEENALLASCHLTLKEDVDVASGKSFLNFLGRSPFQIIVLLVGLAGLGFSIWMLVDCARKKIKNKALWIVLILLGQIAVVFTFASGNVNVNGTLGFILAISTLSMSENVIALRIAIPVGAIIYLAVRNRLIIKNTPIETTAEVNTSTLKTLKDSVIAENGLPNDYGKADAQLDNKEETERKEDDPDEA